MRFERERRALFASALLLAAGSCARHDAPAMARAAPADTAAARAIVRDRPERLVLPLAPRGAGRVIYGRIAPARAALDLPPPPADAGEPPAPAAPAPTDPASLELNPPIPRGSPRTPSGGRRGPGGAAGRRGPDRAGRPRRRLGRN